MASEDPREERALSLWREAQQFHMAGELERAIELYSESIALFPTAEAHTFRGWAYSFQGRIDDAIAECKRAIEVDPSFGNPYNDIGSYLMKLGRPEEAEPWLQRAKDAPRYEPRHFPYLNLGRLYAARGDLLRAIAELEDAVAIAPEDPHCQAALARVRATLN